MVLVLLAFVAVLFLGGGPADGDDSGPEARGESGFPGRDRTSCQDEVFTSDEN